MVSIMLYVVVVLFYRRVKCFLIHCNDCACGMCVFRVQTNYPQNNSKIHSTLVDGLMDFRDPYLLKRKMSVLTEK